MTKHPKRIYCALDTADLAAAGGLAGQLKDQVAGLKLGLEFFAAHGPAGFKELSGAGAPLFLDLKLHDIPNTVAGAMRSLAPLGPRMITLHCQGGGAMMRAGAEAGADAADKAGRKAPLLLGVTVLTSLDEADLNSVGVGGRAADQVARLADLAKSSGLDGVVCSPREIELVRQTCGGDFLIVVPGIRPGGSPLGDQKRVMTPAEAIGAGADFLVIGRPITGAEDPAAAAAAINQEMGG